ncbi:unnamed protein product [Triticum turgidum subsp. durum]|uniref:Sialate O-acetylesterase domain-containing protein n=1 Tax=Triticum turgidum subsp. durum TaxID=4567 RepID=A0A9R1PNT6_TRITD|nr:unnamed protein product [Triticum turgidum subsp. durum]
MLVALPSDHIFISVILFAMKITISLMIMYALKQVALASGNKRNIEKVREAQLSINLLNVVTVDAIGLPLNEDNLHLTTEAQVKLGESLAQTYISNFLQATC